MSNFRSIKTRLLLFGLCISLIPISIITTIYYLNARSTLKKQILQDFKAIAETKKTHTISFVEVKKERAIDFSSDGFIRDSLEKISQGAENGHTVIMLNKHLVNNKMPLDHHIVAIDVVGIDGTIVSSTTEESIGRELAVNERFPQLVNGVYGDVYVKEPHRCYNMPGYICMYISAPMFAKIGDRFIGSIRLHYDTSALNSIVNDRFALGETGEVYIVNRNNVMLTESRFIENAILNQVVETEPIRKILESGEEMTGIYQDYRDVPIVGASINIPEYGWILLVEMNKAEAFASLRRLGIIALVVGGVCSAVAISMGIIFSASTSRPINKLKSATETIADGNLKHRVDINRRDEIGVLGNSFNIMADKLMKKDMAVLAENNERKATEEELKESEARFRSILSSLYEAAIIVYDRDGKITSLWGTTEMDKRYGIRAVAAVGKSIRELVPPERAEQLITQVRNIIDTGAKVIYEHLISVPGGNFWHETSLSPMRDSNGNITAVVGFIRDITERKQAEEQIKVSLQEKEVLLREVHHRVKNNLQIISSMLDMSSLQTDSQEAIDLFTDSRNRVNAMAIIHSQLYRSERFDQINMEEHIMELCTNLLQAYAMDKEIVLDIKSANLYLSINQAIPCALVLNELITNVCKHAYSEGQKGTISISMEESDGDTILIRVKDDGMGIPEDIDIAKVRSLGLSLVRNLVYNQLYGRIDVMRNKGTEFHVEFKVVEKEVKA